MTIGTCRTDGCEEPRRVRRGMIEPFCERCYRAARERFSRALAEEEAAREGAKRYRRFSLGAEKEAEPAVASGPRGPRMISEELLGEVRRRYEQDGRPLGEIARELVDQTGYASARSAETALRSQFKRRGWVLRSRKQAGALLRRRRTEEAHEGLERAA